MRRPEQFVRMARRVNVLWWGRFRANSNRQRSGLTRDVPDTKPVVGAPAERTKPADHSAALAMPPHSASEQRVAEHQRPDTGALQKPTPVMVWTTESVISGTPCPEQHLQPAYSCRSLRQFSPGLRRFRGFTSFGLSEITARRDGYAIDAHFLDAIGS